MIGTVLLLDTETTGTGDDAVCIEVAVALYSVTHAAVIRAFSSLIRAESNAAEATNRIAPALLADAPCAEHVWARVDRFVGVEPGTIVMAHGADFDRRFVPPKVLPPGARWVCTLNDIEWPRPSTSRSLVALALAHDLGVSHAHRAAADVDLLARLLTRAHALGSDLEAMLARGLRPKGTFQALVSYDDRAQASERGFRWNQPGLEQMWTRRMAVEDAAALPFKVRRIDE